MNNSQIAAIPNDMIIPKFCDKMLSSKSNEQYENYRSICYKIHFVSDFNSFSFSLRLSMIEMTKAMWMVIMWTMITKYSVL